MNKKHWIMLSAPPLSGKDTLAALLLNEFSKQGAMHVKLSQPLKSGLAAFFGLTREQVEWFEQPENKLTPHELLGGLCWRQAQIDLAEKLVKPHWGKDTFVKIAVNKANQEIIDTGMGYASVKYIIVSDLGFEFERDWLFKHKPYLSCTIVNIQRDGCDFRNDSREWVYWTAKQLREDHSLWNITIANNNDPQDMLSKFKDLYYSSHGGSLVDTTEQLS